MGKLGDNPIYSTCDICQNRKQVGPNRYEGGGVPQWGLWICSTCRLTDDVPPAYEVRVASILDAKGIKWDEPSGIVWDAPAQLNADPTDGMSTLDRVRAAIDVLAERVAEGAFLPADDDEDVHTAIERGLLEILGPELGGRLRAGRTLIHVYD